MHTHMFPVEGTTNSHGLFGEMVYILLTELCSASRMGCAVAALQTGRPALLYCFAEQCKKVQSALNSTWLLFWSELSDAESSCRSSKLISQVLCTLLDHTIVQGLSSCNSEHVARATTCSPQAKITGGDGAVKDVRNTHGGRDVHRARAREGGAPRCHGSSGESARFSLRVYVYGGQEGVPLWAWQSFRLATSLYRICCPNRARGDAWSNRTRA